MKPTPTTRTAAAPPSAGRWATTKRNPPAARRNRNSNAAASATGCSAAAIRRPRRRSSSHRRGATLPRRARTSHRRPCRATSRRYPTTKTPMRRPITTPPRPANRATTRTTRATRHTRTDPARFSPGEPYGNMKRCYRLARESTYRDKLRASHLDEGRYRLLVESITDYAIYMLDTDGIVYSWNAGARRFKGYDAAEIVGRHFSEFYTPEDRAAGLPARALAQAAETGAFQGEGWRVRKDGSRFWASVVVDAIRNSRGELQGFAKINGNLSD